MPTILIAVHEPHEPETPSDAPKEQLGRVAPDLSSAEKGPGIWDQEGCNTQGTTGNQPPEKPAEYMSENDPACEDAHETLQSGGSVSALALQHSLTVY